MGDSDPGYQSGAWQSKLFVPLFITYYVGRVGLEPTTGGL